MWNLCKYAALCAAAALAVLCYQRVFVSPVPMPPPVPAPAPDVPPEPTPDILTPAVPIVPSVKAKAMITGPSEAAAGTIIILDGSQSVGDHFAWTVTPDLSTITLLPIEDGRRAILAGTGGTYVVSFAASNSTSLDILKWPVKVTGGSTPPTPGPSPQPSPHPAPSPTPAPEPQPIIPTPTPTFPLGKYGLSSHVYTLAMAVQSSTRATEASGLADGGEKVIAAIKAGKASSMLRPMRAQHVSTLLKANIKTPSPAWTSFGDFMNKGVTDLYNQGKIDTESDWIDLIGEVTTALRAVAAKGTQSAFEGVADQ